MTLLIILLFILIVVLVRKADVPAVVTPTYLKTEIARKERKLENGKLLIVIMSLAGVVTFIYGGALGLVYLVIIAGYIGNNIQLRRDITSLKDQLRYLDSARTTNGCRGSDHDHRV